MYPVIVSFYTKDWKYPQHAQRLKKECEALGLEYMIEERPSKGGYIQNCCIKPFFILDCLKKGRPVLWIDVDGSILQKPDFFLDHSFDFQARKMPETRRRTWHVGTMYFNPTAKTLKFVQAWCENTGDMTDESSLDQTFKSKDWGLSVRNIPSEYFRVLKPNEQPSAGDVICHRLSNGQSKQQQTRQFEQYEKEIG